MRRITQLDSVRALAVIAVFIFHSLGTKLLWAGVDLFFVLSGFLITNVLLEAKRRTLSGYFAHFYSRRARRILVPYLVTLVVVSCFFGTAWLDHWYLYILLANLLYPLHAQFPSAFGGLWSLAVEEQFYLLWPFAVYFLNERQLRYLSILLIGVAPLLRGLVHFSDPWVPYMLTPFRMDLLASGALLCLIWRARPDVIERRGAAFGFTSAVLGLAIFAVLARLRITQSGNTTAGNVLIYEASLLVCLGLIVYALSGWHVGWLRFGPLRFIGKISYTLYLIHPGILDLLRPSLHGFSLTVCGFALTVAYAWLSWHFLESKLLHVGKEASVPLEPRQT